MSFVVTVCLPSSLFFLSLLFEFHLLAQTPDVAGRNGSPPASHSRQDLQAELQSYVSGVIATDPNLGGALQLLASHTERIHNENAALRVEQARFQQHMLSELQSMQAVTSDAVAKADAKAGASDNNLKEDAV